MRLSRSFLPAAVLIFFLASAPQLGSQKRPAQKPAQSFAAKEQDREGIAAMQKGIIAASMAFDVNAMLDQWTDNAVLLAPRHEPIVGKAALRHFFREKKDRYANYDMLAYEEQWDEVMVIGEYAYQWGTVSFRIKPPTGGEIGGAVHAVRILKREEDGYWRVSRAMWNDASDTSDR
jgi:ketosteroid isomerase-like protein